MPVTTPLGQSNAPCEQSHRGYFIFPSMSGYIQDASVAGLSWDSVPRHQARGCVMLERERRVGSPG